MVLLNFFAIFLEFSITRRVVTEQNETTIFIFSLSLRFPTYFVLKRSHNGVFQLFEFFAIYFNFLLLVVLERNETIIFIFSLSRPFPTNFGLQ